ncbi:hypothetical protein OC844_007378 [Tilletia horrida]|nr:hypothetical protein OC844_007378 [Tilletia horrida]
MSRIPRISKSARKSLDTSEGYGNGSAHCVGCLVIFAAALRLLIRCGTIRAAQYSSDGETSADDKDEYTDPNGEEKQDGVDKARKSASLAPLAGAVASITQKIDAFIENIIGDTVQDRHVTSLILAFLRQLLEALGEATSSS